MKLDIKIINKNIFHIIFENKLEMTSTLLRIQEHYESPKFKGKVFTLGQYREYYINKHGNFNYYEIVDGMNFPATAFNAFLKGSFDPLSEKEQYIIDRIAKGSACKYVIATYGEADKETIEHEICHALYFTEESYRDQVNTIVDSYDMSDIKKWLKGQDYDEAVLNDEIHAYNVCDSKYLDEHNVATNPQMQSDLHKLRLKYKPKFKL